MLQVLHLGNQLLVGRQKWQLGVPVAGHQCFTNKNFPRRDRVNPTKINPAAVVDHQAIQRGPLQRRSCVNHVSDAWNGERSLGHVGRQYDAATAVPVKNTVLLGLAQPRKQRQHFGVAGQRLMRQMLAQMIGRFTNLTLARQKNQYVTGAVWPTGLTGGSFS